MVRSNGQRALRYTIESGVQALISRANRQGPKRPASLIVGVGLGLWRGLGLGAG